MHGLDRYRDRVLGDGGGSISSEAALKGVDFGGGGCVAAVEGQVRYGSAFARLCSREAVLREDIAEERKHQRKLQNDALALVVSPTLSSPREEGRMTLV